MKQRYYQINACSSRTNDLREMRWKKMFAAQCVHDVVSGSLLLPICASWDSLVDKVLSLCHAINAVFFLQHCNTVQLILSLSRQWPLCFSKMRHLSHKYCQSGTNLLLEWSPLCLICMRNVKINFLLGTAPHFWLFLLKGVTNSHPFIYCTWICSTSLYWKGKTKPMQHMKA